MSKPSAKTYKYENYLIREKSPYLLQHAHDPVDWYPWSEKAFQKAKEESKPVFLSIGYATCHWCHVMEHESFEDEEVAAILNKYFVCIKVDREERPDIDQVYMAVCQAMTGSGGWPLSIFMTPDEKPFFSGTYFPKRGRMGIPGFMDVIQQIAKLWKKDRSKLINAGNQVTIALRKMPGERENEKPPDVKVLQRAFNHLSQAFDEKWGGFSYAPKFPTPHNLTFLLRWYKRTHDKRALYMATKTLGTMRSGGIFDQIGYGFHRYSVDEKWLVPHFEKMLYDQALLALAYVETYLVTKEEKYARTSEEIFTYVLRDMTSAEGAFYTAEDADSEGREGAFYIWKPEEIKRVLGEKEGDLFCRLYGVTPKGNFENGYSVLHLTMSPRAFARKQGLDPKGFEVRMEYAREKLFEAREKRERPFKDDKILTSWNALMIASLAKAHQVLRSEKYLSAAKKAAKFIQENMVTKEGKLYRRYRNGHRAHEGFLDDYAFFIWALIELYESTFDVGYLEKAIAFTKKTVDLFWDKEEGGFYYTSRESEELVLRNKEIHDGAMPSGNSVAASNLIRLGRMVGDVSLERKAEQLILAFGKDIVTYPMGHTFLLGAVDFMIGPSKEIVIVGSLESPESQKMLKTVYTRYLPNKVLLFKNTDKHEKVLTSLVPYAAHLEPIDRHSTAYICEKFTCKAPVIGSEGLEFALNQEGCHNDKVY